MTPTEFALWKNDSSGKWIRYSGNFSTDRTTLSYQRGVRLIINNGWTPYDAGIDLYKSKKQHEPLDIGYETADLSKLDKLIQQHDPVTYALSKDFRDFFKNYQEKSTKSQNGDIIVYTYTPEEKQEIHSKALLKAVENYKSGKFVPAFLMPEVISYIARNGGSK